MYYLAFLLILISPIAMIAVSFFWKKFPPQRTTKSRIAYRSELAMRSEESWNFAHRQLSKLWFRIGVLSGILSGGAMVIWDDVYSSFFLWLLVGQMLLFCASVLLVESLLKAKFD
jgi:hypothetical protein